MWEKLRQLLGSGGVDQQLIEEIERKQESLHRKRQDAQETEVLLRLLKTPPHQKAFSG